MAARQYVSAYMRKVSMQSQELLHAKMSAVASFCSCCGCLCALTRRSEAQCCRKASTLLGRPKEDEPCRERGGRRLLALPMTDARTHKLVPRHRGLLNCRQAQKNTCQ